ncbi:EAL domain-containing protein [Blautia sp. SC05B48]|nr:EAL domain-containing protein [Blautia sp. SC05B48]
MASGICGISSRKFSSVLKCFSSSFRRTGKLCKKDLLFNEVKIDRKFLGDSLTENTQIVLQEVFHMLKRMGKSIVCEGVETKEIAEFLKAEGCDEIQGFLYYRPMCQKDFETLLHI